MPAALRSILFVPGDRPERFSKALAVGADAVCLDLEDAVLPADRLAARENVIAAIAQLASATGLFVRINSLRSQDGLRDLIALASAQRRPGAIVVPKIESAQEVQIVRGVLAAPEVPVHVVGLIETLAGLHCVEDIATAPGVSGLMLGTADLSVEMGTSMDWESMLYARHRTVFAAQRAAVAAIDGAWTKLEDTDGLQAETVRAADLGFTGKICIHPRQVSAVHAALLPGEEAIVYAREVIAASNEGSRGVTVVRGRMIDRPIFEAAKRTLARAGLDC